MPIVEATRVRLAALGTMQPGMLADCGEMGRCIIVGGADQHLGILNLARSTLIEYFLLSRRETEIRAVGYSGVELAVDVRGSARTAQQITGVDDYSNMIAVDSSGASICVRKPEATGHSVRRISLADWSLLPQDNRFAEFQYFTDWRLMARFTSNGEWTELLSLPRS